MRALAAAAVVAGGPRAAAQLADPAAGDEQRSGERWLRERLGALATDPRLRGAQVGYAVTDLDAARTLAARRAAEAVSIASTAKLFTAAAALSWLGPGYRFSTEIYAVSVSSGRVAGDLYVRGSGDPSLREATLWQMARDLKLAGIREIAGGIVIDDTLLDAQRLPPLFETHATDAYYRPAVGALSLEENVVWVGVRPGARAGQRAEVVLIPTSDYLHVECSARTVGSRRRAGVRVETAERPDRTLVRVTGRIRVGQRVLWERKRVGDPGLHFGWALVEQLRAQGIHLGQVKVRRGQVGSRHRRLIRHRSEPLAALVSRMNKTSSNASAELLLKVLGAEVYGAPGSSANGLRALRDWSSSVGLDPSQFALRNGSGLYDATSVTPMQVVALLRQARRSPRYGPEFVTSLSIAALDGTLKTRYLGSGAEAYVRAKTGTLARVVALSGYAMGSAGSATLAFAIFVTELPDGAIKGAREVADEMATSMVTYLEDASERQSKAP